MYVNTLGFALYKSNDENDDDDDDDVDDDDDDDDSRMFEIYCGLLALSPSLSLSPSVDIGM